MSAPDSAFLSNIPHFRDVTGNDPYPWQGRLYQSLLTGAAPGALDIPTGIGKTTAVLLYLLALAAGATLPRRLLYVVDRRAVVDQTAAQIRHWLDRIATLAPLAERLDALAAFPAPAPVALGVLRGGLADDGDWRTDPARPAVIVGTVDMIGSRLLFSGYGDGQSRRAQHAGLLGQDSFLLLDEAHLSPGMAGLIRGIERLRSDGERMGGDYKIQVADVSAERRQVPTSGRTHSLARKSLMSCRISWPRDGSHSAPDRRSASSPCHSF